MTELRLRRTMAAASFASLILMVAIPVLAQNNYRFNMGSVSSTATSMSNGSYGAPYTNSGTCIGTSCSGGLSGSGYHDDGSSTIDTVDGYGEIISSAKGESQNNTTASTSDSAGINLSISSVATAYATANYSGGYAQSPAVYKMPFRDGTSMSMAWHIYIGSTLTVTNLKAFAQTNLQGGTGFATANWIITVQELNGTIVAQYTQDNSGSSFTAQIPANTIVTIGWTTQCGAKTSYNWGATSAYSMASVIGQVSITPVGQ
jgi:hypothetical protein